MVSVLRRSRRGPLFSTGNRGRVDFCLNERCASGVAAASALGVRRSGCLHRGGKSHFGSMMAVRIVCIGNPLKTQGRCTSSSICKLPSSRHRRAGNAVGHRRGGDRVASPQWSRRETRADLALAPINIVSITEVHSRRPVRVTGCLSSRSAGRPLSPERPFDGKDVAAEKGRGPPLALPKRDQRRASPSIECHMLKFFDAQFGEGANRCGQDPGTRIDKLYW